MGVANQGFSSGARPSRWAPVPRQALAILALMILLLGAIMPVGIAMQKTGVDAMIGKGLVDLAGDFSPLAVLAALFLAKATRTQLMANVAAVIVMLPPAVAAALSMGVSAMIMAIATGAQTAFLTPVSTPNNLMIQGPGAYKFGDYWNIGSVTLIWWFVVVIVVIPLYWRF
jgi:di/tricarboxylate transporter